METNNFNDAISVLPYRIRNILSLIEYSIKTNTYEIRVRQNRPLMLYGSYGSVFIKNDGTFSKISYHGAVYINFQDIEDIISAICNYSVYSRQSEIINGCLTYGKGHRVGISGEAVTYNGQISMIKNIDSVCIRIAKDKISLPECVSDILSNNFDGIIIAGRPCSGKTTLLRAVAEKLSSDYFIRSRKIVIVDERFELSVNNDINCDILRGYKKQEGIIHAIRTLSPEIIICDEICSVEEAAKIEEGFNSGVKFIVSVHASSYNELMSRNVSRKLVDSGCFDKFIILDDEITGKIAGIYERKDVYI